MDVNKLKLPARFAVLACALGWLYTTAFAQSAPAGAAQDLGVGAVVHITVADEPDATCDCTVDDAGNISMLYASQVPVAGLTPGDAAARLASPKYLGKYYRNPQIIVTLVSPGGIHVVVTGAVTGTVATPGQWTNMVRPDAGLNVVLQQAGPTADADLAHVQITHGLPGAAHATETVNYLSFLNTQSLAGDPMLHNGDMIFVPHKENPQIMITVRGEVAKPGVTSVPAQTTLYDAIDVTGGLMRDADRSDIALLHAGQTTPQLVNYESAMHQPGDPQVNPLLKDGDTVIVKTSAIPNAYTITGGVVKPGEYPLIRPNLTLADALGIAGGPERAKLKELTIVRVAAGGHTRVIKLDARDPAVQGGTLVMPGDSISIPQSSPSNPISPLGVLGVLAGVVGAVR